ncbi:MAG: hypothetical protein QM387_01655 [Spirochaetota bacterium]|nr:hypothetical protein [Spirochaetota bacterium]NMA57089.1 hypothetical protein [Treponema sp.]
MKSFVVRVNYKKISFFLLLFSFAFTILAAQETDAEKKLETKLETGFAFTAYEPSIDSTWFTKESLYLDFTLTSGNILKANGFLEAVYDDENKAPEPLTAEELIKELSLSWMISPSFIATVGKQKLEWGVARAFPSIDSLEALTSVSEPSEKAIPRGLTGFKLDLIPSWFWSFSLLAVPEPRLRESLLACRFEFLVLDADISFGAIRSVKDTNEEPAFFIDAAWFSDFIGFYSEGQVKYKKIATGAFSWEPAITAGLQVEVPAWLNGRIRFIGEYKWQNERKKDRHLLYFGASGIPLSSKIDASLSFICAPQSIEVNENGVLESLSRFSISHAVKQKLFLNASYSYASGLENSDSPFPLFSASRHSVSCSISAFF